MKKLLLSACSFLAFMAASSAQQIKLSDTSYVTSTIINTNDSGSIAYGANGVPVTTGAANNAQWDLSSAIYSVNDTLFMIHTSAPGPYTYANFAIQYIGGTYYTDVRPLFNLNATGLVQAGENIDGRGYDLNGAVSFAQPGDSLIFPAQLDTFTSGHTFIKFPAIYGSTWSSSYTATLNFTLTFAFASLNHAPGATTATVTETDSVIGAGKMRVRNLADTASGYMDVLQVKVKTVEIDSFFLNGSVAPLALTNAFSLTQGDTTTTYSYKFYRRGEVTPLAEMTFPDNTYSYNNVTSTRVHEQRLPISHVGVANVIRANDISIYPNPVTADVINITMPQTNSGTWSYDLMNVLGQTVSTNTLALNGQTKTQIALPNLTPGIYYLHLNNNGQSVVVKTVSVQ